jgi:hypothetical protein
MEPFDQDVVAPAERPSTEALNRGFTAERLALSFFYQQLLAVRTATANDRAKLQTAFIGEGFKVRPSSPASFVIEVSAGMGFYYDPSVPLVIAQDSIVGRFEGVSNVSPWRPIVLGSSVTMTVPAPPPAGQSRYDIIEVRPRRDLADYGQLLRFDQAVNDFVPKSAPAFLRFGSTQTEVGQVVAPVLSTAPLSYKIGTPAPTGTQIEPDVTPGYVKIGRILVADTALVINEAVIVDPRPQIGRATMALKFTMPCTGVSIKPTILELDAPPGIRAAVLGSFVSGANAEVYIFTGQEPRALNVSVQVIGATTPDGPLVGQTDAVIKNNVLNSVVAGNLNNAAMTDPPGLFAVGERYCSIGVNSIFWDGAAFIPPPAGRSPITYFVTANILF